MGYRWEVWAYVPTDRGYAYQEVWQGQSALKCLRMFVKAKRGGAGCVKVEWRG